MLSFQTGHVIEHRRSDIVVVEKHNKTTLLIDIAVPRDTRVEEKEQEKMNTNPDSGRCARNNTEKPGEKPKESWDNREHRVTSERRSTPGNIMITQKRTKHWIV